MPAKVDLKGVIKGDYEALESTHINGRYMWVIKCIHCGQIRNVTTKEFQSVLHHRGCTEKKKPKTFQETFIETHGCFRNGKKCFYWRGINEMSPMKHCAFCEFNHASRPKCDGPCQAYAIKGRSRLWRNNVPKGAKAYDF